MTFFESIATPLVRERKWRVAPCFPRKKEIHEELVPAPLTMRSNDLAQIKEWARREPQANVCVYAVQEEGGLCFLDKDGIADIREAYRRATGKDFRTLFVQSSIQNGVQKGHWYFLQTARTRSFEKNITEEATDGWFSFRVKNYYVCSIGSIHPETGKPYQIMEDYPVAPMPDDLLDWLQEQAIHKPKTRQESQKRGKIKKGQRYSALISEAGRLWAFGYSRDLTIRTAVAWAREKFSLPEGIFNEKLVTEEVEHLVDSYAQGKNGEEETFIARMPITEMSNAERLVEKYGDEMRYCSDRKIWCIWDGSVWNVNDTGGVARRMEQIGLDIYNEAAKERNEKLRKNLVAHAVRSESRHTQENSVALTRYIEGIEIREFAELFDTHPMLLNVKNGTIDLRTGKLLPHRREDFITKLVPIEYSEEAECPQFKDFLNESLQNAELFVYLLKVAGYCLTGLTSEQKWWMFHGVTASGKSTLINILHGLLGPYAMALPENYFLITNNTKDYATANLAGVRLATCVETNEGRRLDTAKLKTLTGGDTISAELKYQNCFTFKPQMKLILATNNRPHVSASDDAIWRRLMPVPFMKTVEEKNRIADLSMRLLGTEGPGILQLAVFGCKEWIKNKLSEPDAVRAAGMEYRTDEDNVQNFLNECCTMDGEIERKELYTAYATWCKANHIWQINPIPFGRDLTRLGVAGDKGNRKWFGIRIRALGDLYN